MPFTLKPATFPPSTLRYEYAYKQEVDALVEEVKKLNLDGNSSKSFLKERLTFQLHGLDFLAQKDAIVTGLDTGPTLSSQLVKLVAEISKLPNSGENISNKQEIRRLAEDNKLILFLDQFESVNRDASTHAPFVFYQYAIIREFNLLTSQVKILERNNKSFLTKEYSKFEDVNSELRKAQSDRKKAYQGALAPIGYPADACVDQVMTLVKGGTLNIAMSDPAVVKFVSKFPNITIDEKTISSDQLLAYKAVDVAIKEAVENQEKKIGAVATVFMKTGGGKSRVADNIERNYVTEDPQDGPIQKVRNLNLNSTKQELEFLKETESLVGEMVQMDEAYFWGQYDFLKQGKKDQVEIEKARYDLIQGLVNRGAVVAIYGASESLAKMKVDIRELDDAILDKEEWLQGSEAQEQVRINNDAKKAVKYFHADEGYKKRVEWDHIRKPNLERVKKCLEVLNSLRLKADSDENRAEEDNALNALKEACKIAKKNELDEKIIDGVFFWVVEKTFDTRNKATKERYEGALKSKIDVMKDTLASIPDTQAPRMKAYYWSGTDKASEKSNLIKCANALANFAKNDDKYKNQVGFNALISSLAAAPNNYKIEEVYTALLNILADSDIFFDFSSPEDQELADLNTKRAEMMAQYNDLVHRREGGKIDDNEIIGKTKQRFEVAEKIHDDIKNAASLADLTQNYLSDIKDNPNGQAKGRMQYVLPHYSINDTNCNDEDLEKIKKVSKADIIIVPHKEGNKRLQCRVYEDGEIKVMELGDGSPTKLQKKLEAVKRDLKQDPQNKKLQSEVNKLERSVKSACEGNYLCDYLETIGGGVKTKSILSFYDQSNFIGGDYLEAGVGVTQQYIHVDDASKLTWNELMQANRDRTPKGNDEIDTVERKFIYRKFDCSSKEVPDSNLSENEVIKEKLIELLDKNTKTDDVNHAKGYMQSLSYKDKDKGKGEVWKQPFRLEEVKSEQLKKKQQEEEKKRAAKAEKEDRSISGMNNSQSNTSLSSRNGIEHGSRTKLPALSSVNRRENKSQASNGLFKDSNGSTTKLPVLVQSISKATKSQEDDQTARYSKKSQDLGSLLKDLKGYSGSGSNKVSCKSNKNESSDYTNQYEINIDSRSYDIAFSRMKLGGEDNTPVAKFSSQGQGKEEVNEGTLDKVLKALGELKIKVQDEMANNVAALKDSANEALESRQKNGTGNLKLKDASLKDDTENFYYYHISKNQSQQYKKLSLKKAPQNNEVAYFEGVVKNNRADYEQAENISIVELNRNIVSAADNINNFLKEAKDKIAKQIEEAVLGMQVSKEMKILSASHMTYNFGKKSFALEKDADGRYSIKDIEGVPLRLRAMQDQLHAMKMELLKAKEESFKELAEEYLEDKQLKMFDELAIHPNIRKTDKLSREENGNISYTFSADSKDQLQIYESFVMYYEGYKDEKGIFRYHYVNLTQDEVIVKITSGIDNISETLKKDKNTLSFKLQKCLDQLSALGDSNNTGFRVEAQGNSEYLVQGKKLTISVNANGQLETNEAGANVELETLKLADLRARLNKAQSALFKHKKEAFEKNLNTIFDQEKIENAFTTDTLAGQKPIIFKKVADRKFAKYREKETREEITFEEDKIIIETKLGKEKQTTKTLTIDTLDNFSDDQRYVKLINREQEHLTTQIAGLFKTLDEGQEKSESWDVAKVQEGQSSYYSLTKKADARDPSAEGAPEFSKFYPASRIGSVAFDPSSTAENASSKIADLSKLRDLQIRIDEEVTQGYENAAKNLKAVFDDVFSVSVIEADKEVGFVKFKEEYRDKKQEGSLFPAFRFRGQKVYRVLVNSEAKKDISEAKKDILDTEQLLNKKELEKTVTEYKSRVDEQRVLAMKKIVENHNEIALTRNARLKAAWNIKGWNVTEGLSHTQFERVANENKIIFRFFLNQHNEPRVALVDKGKWSNPEVKLGHLKTVIGFQESLIKEIEQEKLKNFFDAVLMSKSEGGEYTFISKADDSEEIKFEKIVSTATRRGNISPRIITQDYEYIVKIGDKTHSFDFSKKYDFNYLKSVNAKLGNVIEAEQTKLQKAITKSLQDAAKHPELKYLSFTIEIPAPSSPRSQQKEAVELFGKNAESAKNTYWGLKKTIGLGGDKIKYFTTFTTFGESDQIGTVEHPNENPSALISDLRKALVPLQEIEKEFVDLLEAKKETAILRSMIGNELHSFNFGGKEYSFKDGYTFPPDKTFTNLCTPLNAEQTKDLRNKLFEQNQNNKKEDQENLKLAAGILAGIAGDIFAQTAAGNEKFEYLPKAYIVKDETGKVTLMFKDDSNPEDEIGDKLSIDLNSQSEPIGALSGKKLLAKLVEIQKELKEKKLQTSVAILYDVKNIFVSTDTMVINNQTTLLSVTPDKMTMKVSNKGKVEVDSYSSEEGAITRHQGKEMKLHELRKFKEFLKDPLDLSLKGRAKKAESLSRMLANPHLQSSAPITSDKTEAAYHLRSDTKERSASNPSSNVKSLNVFQISSEENQNNGRKQK